ncbi:WD40 and Hira domain-containing protein [Phanerochaete sordida]|uniref:Protein HIR n=1 Tax=Phanerochaete sordida TaxID=48140 RepID=A0A9P3L8V3_9APHY|nr:WD40 and Hira domain-containing protein [Phanerochaete sordida]
MRFTKPAWVAHKDSSMSSRDQTKRLSMFSCHVHPDSSRIATGGLDAKVRIWSTKPILNRDSELSGRPPKLLCTLTMHTGPVLTVRWAHSGKWLASGSDDAIIMIWDLDPNARGKVWGSDEVNVEGWKPLKRLPGHESDVTDLAWSPGDRYLASVGLDSKLIIWCGFTLERLRTLDQHQGFVKGVCWDPVGEFLATSSDDRSVKIWRTTDWGLEAEVKKPFEDSPGTFFRRLSWSPDGAHITASNATNNKGYVFIAAVIARNSWTSEISLVGHENTVEVAAYNPHIFLRDPSSSVVASNICSVAALGADDRSVSVWQTKSARPLVVAKEVFERQIMDLSWSSDGLTLYAVSSDGTMAVFSFDPDELEGIAPQAAQETYLKKFGFTPPPLPEGFSHFSKQLDTRMTPPPSPGRAPANAHVQDLGFGMSSNGGEVVNKLVAKRKNQKRVQPTFVGSFGGSIPSANIPSAHVPSASTSHGPSSSAHITIPPRTTGRSFHEIAGIVPSRPPPSSMLLSAPEQPASAFGAGRGQSEELQLAYPEDVDMNTDVQISALETNGRGKRKSSVMDAIDDRPSKARTLGGDRPRDVVPVREIAPPGGVVVYDAAAAAGAQNVAARLPIAPLLTYLKVQVEGGDDLLEARNSEDGSPHEVIFVSGKQTQWLDYLSSPVLALAASSCFCAAAMQDGSLNIYSSTGRRLMPTMSLGSPCCQLSANKNCLLALTSSGQVYVWNVKQQRALFPPTSVLPIIGASPNCTVLSATVRPNGAPMLQLSTGITHSYDAALCAWTRLSDGWFAEGSDAWPARTRANSQLAARGPVSALEGALSEHAGAGGAAPRPAWWGTALTLGHLETRMHAARALDSAPEYKQALVLYARKLADEGFRAKAEELVKELFGPTYWRPGREESWSPTLLGFSKRDLLKDVLNIFAKSKTLTKLALDWQDTLKKAANEE